jgi:dipeptidyl aminopeptidase/acylaminoacyl peptidase
MTIPLIVAGLILLGLVLGVAFMARLLIAPGRQRLWTTPAEVGLDFRPVTFLARDGVRLEGWMIPAAAEPSRRPPAVIMVPGWPWNRIGTRADNVLIDLPGSRAINLLPLARRFHDEGWSVLMYDQRNHGESASLRPITSGVLESWDLLGEIDFFTAGDEVDPGRMATVGFSMGGNTVLYALPRTDRLKAAVVVQPNTSSVFGRRYRRDRLGPLGDLLAPFVEAAYRLAGGPRTDSIRPGLHAADARHTPVLYVQGTGDAWGSVDDVRAMAEATPVASAVYPETDHRFGGYQYVLDHPDVVLDFLRPRLSDDGGAGA